VIVTGGFPPEARSDIVTAGGLQVEPLGIEVIGEVLEAASCFETGGNIARSLEVPTEGQEGRFSKSVRDGSSPPAADGGGRFCLVAGGSMDSCVSAVESESRISCSLRSERFSRRLPQLLFLVMS
jgi:hypothetical protein